MAQTKISVTIPRGIDVATFEAMVRQFAPDAVIEIAEIVDNDDCLVDDFAFAISQLPISQWQIIRILLSGADSWSLSQGDPRFSIRTDVAAASRRLKALGVSDPLSKILNKRMMYFPNGDYKGIAYSPTAFGKAVRAKLRENGA